MQYTTVWRSLHSLCWGFLTNLCSAANFSYLMLEVDKALLTWMWCPRSHLWCRETRAVYRTPPRTSCSQFHARMKSYGMRWNGWKFLEKNPQIFFILWPLPVRQQSVNFPLMSYFPFYGRACHPKDFQPKILKDSIYWKTSPWPQILSRYNQPQNLISQTG